MLINLAVVSRPLKILMFVVCTQLRVTCHNIKVEPVFEEVQSTLWDVP